MSCIRISTYANYLPSKFTENGIFTFDVNDDFDIKISRFLEQLTDINKIKVDGILGFDLPGGRNDILLKKYVDPHGTAKGFIDVRISASDSNELYFYELYVVDYIKLTDQYSCELRAGYEHWIKSAKELKLNQINFTDDEKVTYSIDSVKEQNLLGKYDNGTLGVRYPLANYGKFTNIDKGLQLQDYRPYLSYLWVLQKGFCKLGWKFRSPIFESEFGRRLITYILDKNFGVDDKRIDSFKVLATADNFGAVTDFQPKKIWFYNVKQNGNGFFNGVAYNAAGIVDVYASINYRFRKETITLRSKNAVLTVSLIYEIEDLKLTIDSQTIDQDFGNFANTDKYYLFKFEVTDVQIDIGSRIYFELSWSTNIDNYTIFYDNFDLPNGKFINQISITPKKVFIQENDEIFIQDLLRPDSFLDFVKGGVHLVCGKIYTDFINREVWIYPTYNTKIALENIQGYFKDDINLDITNKLQEDSEKISNLYSNSKRYERFKYKGSGDAAIKYFTKDKGADYQSYTVDYGPEFDSETIQNENPYFEATYYGTLPGIDRDTGMEISMPFLCSEYTGKQEKATYEIEPRILYWAGNLLQRKPTLDPSWPDGHSWPVLINLGESVNLLPTAWSDAGENKFNSPPALVQNSLAYGERLDKLDLFSLFWRRWLNESHTSKSFDVLLFFSKSDVLRMDFRNTVTFNILGRTSIGRLISINDFSLCESTSTPVKLIPVNTANNSCITIPDSGNGGELLCNGNAPELEINKVGDCYNFGLGGSTNSAITTVVYQYKYIGDATWTTASSLCDPEKSFDVRMIVSFEDNCPDIARFRFVDACGNSPIITGTFNYTSFCFTAEIEGIINSEIDEIGIEFSTDDGETFSSYNGPCQVVPNGTEKIIIRAVVSYVDSCEPTELEIEILVPETETDCNNITANVECDIDGNILRTGNALGIEALDLIQYKFNDDDLWITWDEVTPIRPCPFIYRRVIIYCDGECPIYCSEPKTCLCENCNEEFEIVCIDKVLSIDTQCNISWIGPDGYTALGNNVMIVNAGLYTATVYCGDCIYEVEYEFVPPNAGTPIDETIEI